jgi:VCBS repeat-containing protein
MFIEPHGESGDKCKAAEVVHLQVIGNIETVIGFGTLTRASGIAAQVVIGDPVFQGDVIETGPDGRIGIRLIDGAVFNLAPDTCTVLSKFVRDSNGTSDALLFGVKSGRQLATTDTLRVDMPVGSIRDRTHSGGIGILPLIALTFSAINEVQAADPNVTFLDDGSIAYKDFAHGVFELVTKEAIPRHFFVEDPGQTIVLRASGSAISVNQVTNSVTRMEELRAAQQGVLADFAKGPGARGSSTPPSVNALSVVPINVIQTDILPTPNSLPPMPPISVVPEIVVLHPPPPPLSPPSLKAVTGPTETDTGAFDDFTATSAILVASSPISGAKLTFGISGGTVGHTVLEGQTYDVSKIGSYGTLYVNSTSGTYTFVPDSGAINALTTTTTESFTVTVSDGKLSSDQTFTITINGVNDAAVISGVTTGSVIEAGGVANTAPGISTATGMLTDTDIDNTPNSFTAVSSPTASAGGYGTFTMTAAGVWTYKLNDANSAVQALGVGSTLTDTFTVTTIDGTAKVVTMTINGANDAPTAHDDVLSAPHNASEDSALTIASTALLTNDTDPDTGDHLTIASVSATSTSGATVTLSGTDIFYDPTHAAALQALRAGETTTDTFTYTIDDGHGGTDTATVTLAVAGINDAPTITSETDAPTQAVIVNPAVLAEGVNTNSLGLSTETFDSQQVGSGNFYSAALDATFSGSGNVGVINGSIPGVAVALFLGPLPGSLDTTNYLSISANGVETITFASEKNTFGLYWGTIDSFNTISFYDGSILVASYTGAEIGPLLSGHQGAFASNGYVEFSGIHPFDRVVLETGNANAFEIENISAGFVPGHHAKLAAPISGTLSVHDSDIGDTLTASVIGNASIEFTAADGSTTLPNGVDIAALIDAGDIRFDTVQTNGGTQTLHWTYNPVDPDLDFLKVGDKLTIQFTAQVNDGHGNVGNQVLTISIVGAAASQDMSELSVVSGTVADETFSNVGNSATIFGGGGSDNFVFKDDFGAATIGDFDVNNDKIEISHSLFGSIAEILATATDSGPNTVVTDGTAAHNSITLKNVAAAQLQAFDFHLF